MPERTLRKIFLALMCSSSALFIPRCLKRKRRTQGPSHYWLCNSKAPSNWRQNSYASPVIEIPLLGNLRGVLLHRQAND